LKAADRLAEFGVNAVWFHGFDDSAFEACAARGLAACVEFKTFRADFAEHPELIPIGVDGEPVRFGRLVQGVCLSKRWFLEKIEDDLRAGLAEHRPAGVWLDYLTGCGWFETPEPDLQASCFCDDCLADFREATRVTESEPAAILASHGEAWTRHGCLRVAAFGARYARIIRAADPNCVVGAYMCPWRPEEHGGALTRIFRQDYQLLAGSIDVFTPLIYARKSGRPATWGREFMEACGGFIPAGVKVQLILDVLDFPESLAALAEADGPGRGVQLFGGAEVFTDTVRAREFRELVTQLRVRASA